MASFRALLKIRGVTYDVGRVLAGNSRPVFDDTVVARELAIIHQDLHCNAVRICGRDLDRLVRASELALAEGLEVWFSPEMWNQRRSVTRRYIAEGARRASRLNTASGGRVVYCVGTEFSLFVRGIIPGLSLVTRLGRIRVYAHSERSVVSLSNFLSDVVGDVRREFTGRITYASLPWEEVDWTMFDIVGVDHYRDDRIKDRYTSMLQDYFNVGKPVVVTEFGMRTYEGATSDGTLGFGIVDTRSVARSHLPVIGHHFRPRLTGNPVRDEALQAREIIDVLNDLQRSKVTGAFVCTFCDYGYPNDEDPRYDLDMSSMSLVKNLGSNYGTVYREMNWEPKESFRSLANFYSREETTNPA